MYMYMVFWRIQAFGESLAKNGLWIIFLCRPCSIHVQCTCILLECIRVQAFACLNPISDRAIYRMISIHNEYDYMYELFILPDFSCVLFFTGNMDMIPAFSGDVLCIVFSARTSCCEHLQDFKNKVPVCICSGQKSDFMVSCYLVHNPMGLQIGGATVNLVSPNWRGQRSNLLRVIRIYKIIEKNFKILSISRKHPTQFLDYVPYYKRQSCFFLQKFHKYMYSWVCKTCELRIFIHLYTPSDCVSPIH